MPVELACDLVALALYDIVVYADDSTSMKYAEGGSRIDDLKVILQRVAEVATLFDEDGESASTSQEYQNAPVVPSSHVMHAKDSKILVVK